jgi:dGTPase
MLEDIAIWRMATEETKSLGLKRGDGKFLTYTVRALINRMVGDAIETSAKLIEASGVKAPGDAPSKGMTLIAWSQEFQVLTSELRTFLYENLYFSQELNKLNQLSKDRMSFLFETFVKHPELAGSQVRRRMEADGIHRAVTDYIAGMTDVFAICEYHRLK